MRIERDWLWHSLNNAGRPNRLGRRKHERPYIFSSTRKGIARINLAEPSKLAKASAGKDSQWLKNINLPSLNLLREIKEEKLLHIKNLVKNNLYDTDEKLKATAKKIVDLLLAED